MDASLAWLWSPLFLFLLLLFTRLYLRTLWPGAPAPPPPSSLWSSEQCTLDGGTPTELLHFPAGQGSRSSGGGGKSPVHLLIFPGNPGSPYFYLDYATTLYLASGKRLPITICSHACHSVGSTGVAGSRPRHYDLSAQVRHKAAIAAHLLRTSAAGKRLVLMGHSVGAYMCLEVMRALPEAAIARALLLFPTLLEIGSSPNGLSMMPLFRFGRWGLAALALLVGALPLGLQRGLARLRLPPDASPATVDAALTIIHPLVGANALYLAYTEMRDIRALDTALVRRLAPRCVAFFGEGDGWNRPQDHCLVEEAFGGQGRVIFCREGHPHGFVVHPKSSAAVAEKCWEWLKDLLE
jgi:hypothetical protein